MRPRRYDAVVVGLLAAALGGCGADATGGTASGGNAKPAEPGVLVDARTPSNQRNPMCGGPVTRTSTYTLFSPIVSADGAVTIGSARAVGDGVELLESEGAIVTDDPELVGHGMSVSWPYEDLRGDLRIDPASRTAFVGMDIHDGQSVLVFWQLAVEPDSHLRGLEIDYVDGTGTARSLSVPLDAAFTTKPEGCSSGR